MVGKRNLSGPKSAPEMPVRIFKTAHGAYKPVLVQTPSLSFPLSPHISVSKFSGCFPTDIGFRARRLSEGGAETTRSLDRSLVLRLVWGKCSVCLLKCAHVCKVVHCVSRLSEPSMRLLWWLLSEAALHGHAPPALGLLLPCRWCSLTQYWRKLGLSQPTVRYYGPRCLPKSGLNIFYGDFVLMFWNNLKYIMMIHEHTTSSCYILWNSLSVSHSHFFFLNN